MSRTLYVTVLADNSFREFREMTLAILNGITSGQPYIILVSRDDENAPVSTLFCDHDGVRDGERLEREWSNRWPGIAEYIKHKRTKNDQTK